MKSAVKTRPHSAPVEPRCFGSRITVEGCDRKTAQILSNGGLIKPPGSHGFFYSFLRNFISISFALLFLCPLGCIHIYRAWEKYLLHEKAERMLMQHIPTDQLQVFSFSISDAAGLEWERADEFRYQGKFFDVARAEYGEDSVTFWVLHDEMEEQLEEQVAGLLKEHSGFPVKKEAVKLLRFLHHIVPPVSSTLVNVKQADFFEVGYSYRPSMYKAPCLGLMSPPPREQISRC